MTVDYSKLWKLAQANHMRRQDLAKAAAVSPNTVTKLRKNEVVSMDVMLRICKVFHCDIGDVMEAVEDSES